MSQRLASVCVSVNLILELCRLAVSGFPFLPYLLHGLLSGIALVGIGKRQHVCFCVGLIYLLTLSIHGLIALAQNLIDGDLDIGFGFGAVLVCVELLGVSQLFALSWLSPVLVGLTTPGTPSSPAVAVAQPQVPTTPPPPSCTVIQQPASQSWKPSSPAAAVAQSQVPTAPPPPSSTVIQQPWKPNEELTAPLAASSAYVQPPMWLPPPAWAMPPTVPPFYGWNPAAFDPPFVRSGPQGTPASLY